MIRLIGVLVWKNSTIVQSEGFKHTNVIHDNAIHAVESFRADDLDELVILNVSSRKDSLTTFAKDLERITQKVRIPISAGGHLTSAADLELLLRSGADRIILNTAIVENPKFVKEMSDLYGSSTIVASVDVKSEIKSNTKIVHTNRGRKQTNLGLKEWIQLAETAGAGEIFFNSIDHDGGRKGYDLESLKFIKSESGLPLIGFGGVGEWEHLAEGLLAGCDAVGFANGLHYVEFAPRKAKRYLYDNGFAVRKWG
jgi:cyclase